jgi:hypothetical protein
MRFFLYIWCIALVVGLTPAFSQEAMSLETLEPAAEGALPEPGTDPPPSRVGRVSYVSGDVDLRFSGETGWADANVNQPIFTGEALRTDLRGRAEIRIGANTIGLSATTEIEVASLRDHLIQIALSRGRIDLHLRQAGDGETVEIDLPQGGVWLLGPGRYDIDAGAGDEPPRLAVFDGAAQFAGAGSDVRIESGQTVALTGSDTVAVTTEPAVPDDFVEWSRGREYEETRLSAPYYISPFMTGFAELDAAGVWKINSEYGPVWFPTDPEWAPYRIGHWSWMSPWGWTWIDDQPWGFAPSHYGRWALIDDHWAWVPGGFAAHPVYAPAVVAFLGTPGIGLSSADGAAVAWFPLAPGEVYWPSYTRDLDYVRSLNLGSVQDVGTIAMQADGEPPLEVFNEDFANRQSASVVPRSVFINGRAVALARISLPQQRLQNAPVLMGSPQIAPLAVQRVARVVTTAAKIPTTRVAVKLSRKGGAKFARNVSAPARSRASPPVVIRGAHLHAPFYAGLTRGRQVVVLRVAHSTRTDAGKVQRR